MPLVEQLAGSDEFFPELLMFSRVGALRRNSWRKCHNGTKKGLARIVSNLRYRGMAYKQTLELSVEGALAGNRRDDTSARRNNVKKREFLD